MDLAMLMRRVAGVAHWVRSCPLCSEPSLFCLPSSVNGKDKCKGRDRFLLNSLIPLSSSMGNNNNLKKIKRKKKKKKKSEKKKGEKKRKKAVVFSPQQESQCEQPRSDKVRVGGWASLSLFLSAWGSQQRPYALILDISSLLSSLQYASSSIKQY